VNTGRKERLAAQVDAKYPKYLCTKASEESANDFRSYSFWSPLQKL